MTLTVGPLVTVHGNTAAEQTGFLLATLTIAYLFICVYTCVCMCSCVCKYSCECICVWRSENKFGCHSSNTNQFCLRRSLSLVWNPPSKLMLTDQQGTKLSLSSPPQCWAKKWRLFYMLWIMGVGSNPGPHVFWFLFCFCAETI